MKNRNSTLAAGIATLLAFSIAGVISLWRLIEDGPRPLLVVPALCFPVAIAVWAYLLFRWRGRPSRDSS
jgi:hypothetical protein